MQTVDIYCESLSPLLMNPMTEDQLEDLRTGTNRGAVTKTMERGEVAKMRIYKDPSSGAIAIPSVNLAASLVEAGRQVQYAARKNISTAETTLLYSFLTIQEDYLPLVIRGEGGYLPVTLENMKVDMRRGVLSQGAGKGVAVAIVRPRFDRWGFRVTCEIDDSLIAQEKIPELFRVSGTAVGLCDFRPSRRGPFGRFRMVEMKGWNKDKNVKIKDVLIDSDGAEEDDENTSNIRAVAETSAPAPERRGPGRPRRTN